MRHYRFNSHTHLLAHCGARSRPSETSSWVKISIVVTFLKQHKRSVSNQHIGFNVPVFWLWQGFVRIQKTCLHGLAMLISSGQSSTPVFFASSKTKVELKSQAKLKRDSLKSFRHLCVQVLMPFQSSQTVVSGMKTWSKIFLHYRGLGVFQPFLKVFFSLVCKGF